MSAAFRGIPLDRAEDQAAAAEARMPDHRPDPILDQLIETPASNHDEHDPAPCHHTPPRSLDTVAHQREAPRDLDSTLASTCTSHGLSGSQMRSAGFIGLRRFTEPHGRGIQPYVHPAARDPLCRHPAPARTRPVATALGR